MGKILCRVQEGDNTDIAKTLLFKDIKSQPYVGGDENLERPSKTIEESSSFEDEGATLHSKLASCQSNSLHVQWSLLTWGCH